MFFARFLVCCLLRVYTAREKGGRAPEADPLQVLIQQMVQEDLQITAQQLWHRLRNEEGKGVIISVDPEPPKSNHTIRMIHFRATDGKVKTAPISGLKHRLSRARRKMNVSLAG
jgi:hypothetical protein